VSSARDQKSRAEFFVFRRLAVVHEHGNTVWRLARRLLPDEADAAECFQETFVAALGGSRSAAVTNWPGLRRRICAARAIDLIRRRIRDRRRTAPLDAAATLATPTASPADVAASGERADRLRLALAALPGRQAEVFTLAVIEALPRAAVATLEKVREMKSVRYRSALFDVEKVGVTEAAGTGDPFCLTIETADGVRLEMGPLVTVFRRDGSLMLDTEGQRATTWSSEEGKDRQQERPDLLGQFRQADGSWGEPIEGKQVGTVAARGYRATKKHAVVTRPARWLSPRDVGQGSRLCSLASRGDRRGPAVLCRPSAGSPAKRDRRH
jgi:RNA polymerase sigma factor (sigma-70 family)